MAKRAAAARIIDGGAAAAAGSARSIVALYRALTDAHLHSLFPFIAVFSTEQMRTVSGEKPGTGKRGMCARANEIYGGASARHAAPSRAPHLATGNCRLQSAFYVPPLLATGRCGDGLKLSPYRWYV